MYLVIGSYHWIGFHLTQHLLNKGEAVIGLDQIETELEENLHMFIGRNSLFHAVQSETELTSHSFYSQVDCIISIDNQTNREITDNDVSNYVKLVDCAVEHKTKKITQIELPLLFGEWMPRTKEYALINRKQIKMDSAQFRQNAIYIYDFIPALLQIISQKQKPEKITYKSLQKQARDEFDHANTIYVRETDTVENRLKQLNQHFDTFSFLYEAAK